MNQRSYQVECSIYDHQCPTGFPKCELHLCFILLLFTLLLFGSITLRGVVIEVLKFFVNASRHGFTYVRIALVLYVRFLAHHTAHRV